MDTKQEFLRIAIKHIKREGLEDFLAWLESTDFFFAPASTRHHGAYEMGLAIHSLNVYTQLKQLAKVYGLGRGNGIENVEESIAIAGLFHDVCKVGVYKTEMRWKKNQNQQWESYQSYRFEEDFAYGGHGAKSVYLIQSFMDLTLNEASAINCHMGAWDATTYSNPSTVYERNLLAWLLHVADEAATYVIESNRR